MEPHLRVTHHSFRNSPRLLLILLFGLLELDFDRIDHFKAFLIQIGTLRFKILNNFSGDLEFREAKPDFRDFAERFRVFFV